MQFIYLRAWVLVALPQNGRKLPSFLILTRSEFWMTCRFLSVVVVVVVALVGLLMVVVLVVVVAYIWILMDTRQFFHVCNSVLRLLVNRLARK